MDEIDLLCSLEEGTCLGDVDLGLTVLEVDINGFILDSLAVSGRVEDVANLLAIFKGCVWHLNALVIVSVCGGHKELTSLEGVEVVSDISLLEWMVPDSHVLSSTVDGSGHLVDVRVGVHVLPQRLSISWVVATTVLLLTTIVVEWNTLSCECECEC